MAVHDLGDMSVEFTRAEYARYRGLSQAAVDKAVATGRISLLPGGLIDPQVADREWAENTGSQRGVRRPAGAESEGNGSPAVGGLGATLNAVKIEHEQLKIEKTRAELEEARGNMVRKADTERWLEEEGQRARDAVLQVPVQVAAALAACGDPQGCRKLVHDALRVALQGCANGGEVADGRTGTV